MHGLVCGFPNCVGFADGTKQRIRRPGDDDVQTETFCGQHKFKDHAAPVWTDVPFDMSLIGSNHARGVYKNKYIARHGAKKQISFTRY